MQSKLSREGGCGAYKGPPGVRAEKEEGGAEFEGQIEVKVAIEIKQAGMTRLGTLAKVHKLSRRPHVPWSHEGPRKNPS